MECHRIHLIVEPAESHILSFDWAYDFSRGNVYAACIRLVWCSEVGLLGCTPTFSRLRPAHHAQFCSPIYDLVTCTSLLSLPVTPCAFLSHTQTLCLTIWHTFPSPTALLPSIPPQDDYQFSPSPPPCIAAPPHPPSLRLLHLLLPAPNLPSLLPLCLKYITDFL